MTVLKVVCGWCGAHLGEKDGQGEEGVTHGICERCLAKVRSQMGKVQRLTNSDKAIAVPNCPLKLEVCFPSCFWRHGDRCIFPCKRGMKPIKLVSRKAKDEQAT